MNFSKKDKLVLATHGSNFHADDLCATAVLKTYFKYFHPKIKLKIIRTLDKAKLAAADIVYDIGGVYDPKKGRFDHHQKGGSGERVNGTKYAAVGLVWKEFGVQICMEHTLRITGKKATKSQAMLQALIIEEKLISHIDAMDNGQMTYKELFEDVNLPTFDKYFEMCKVSISSQNRGIVETNKLFDKMFFSLVSVLETVLQNILTYAIYKAQDNHLAMVVYEKAKDKRVIIGDRFYYFNFAKFPEPLVTIYPDLRGTWAAKNVRKSEFDYEARFYFPESWAGLMGEELEKTCGVKGAQFCHNGKFLIVGKTKETVLEMVKKAFEIEKI